MVVADLHVRVHEAYRVAGLGTRGLSVGRPLAIEGGVIMVSSILVNDGTRRYAISYVGTSDAARILDRSFDSPQLAAKFLDWVYGNFARGAA